MEQHMGCLTVINDQKIVCQTTQRPNDVSDFRTNESSGHVANKKTGLECYNAI